MENLYDVSHTYVSTACRGDFVVVSSVLSVASPWRSPPSSGRFVVFGPSSSHPSSSRSGFHAFYWSATRIALEGFDEVSLLVHMCQPQVPGLNHRWHVEYTRATKTKIV